MMRRSLLILGAGGHGRVIAETAVLTGVYDSIAFLDDRYSKTSASVEVNGIPLIGKLNDAKTEEKILERFTDAALGLGQNYLRMHWYGQLSNSGYKLEPLVHPSAYVSKSATLGYGSVVLALASIQCCASVGNGVIVNDMSCIEHDCRVKDGAHICPGAVLGGSVSVGSCSWIGLRTAIKNNVSIGNNVLVGASSLVLRDIEDDMVVYGAPAKVVSTGGSDAIATGAR